MQQPSIGRIVIAKTAPGESNNNAKEAPAIISRVFGQQPNGAWTVNVRVLFDGDAVGWKTSVSLYETEADVPEGNTHAAYWPPRV